MAAETAVDKNWTHVNKPGSLSIRAINADFPSTKAVTGRASDDLLFPTKMLTSGKVQTILQAAGREGQRLVSVAVAENLMEAISAGNRLNDLWVSFLPVAESYSDDRPCRPMRIDRVYSLSSEG